MGRPRVSPGKGGPSASGVCVRGWRGQHGDSGVPRVPHAAWCPPLAPPGGQQGWGSHSRRSPLGFGVCPLGHGAQTPLVVLVAWAEPPEHPGGLPGGGGGHGSPCTFLADLWLLCSTPRMHPPPEMPAPCSTATKSCPWHPTEGAQHHLHGWDFPHCIFFFLTCKAPEATGSGAPRPQQRGGGRPAPHLQLKAIPPRTHGLHPSQKGLLVAEGSRAEQLHPRYTFISSSKWPGRAASVLPSPGAPEGRDVALFPSPSFTCFSGNLPH